jgi:isopenicillin N synthase-like dioxygenase
MHRTEPKNPIDCLETMGIDKHVENHSGDIAVGHYRTARFSVLEPLQDVIENKKNIRSSSLPALDLVDLLLHDERNKTKLIQKHLRQALEERGFCLLTCSTNSQPGRVIQNLQASLQTDLFPANGSTKNAGQLPTSDTVYVSEKGVPMYKLGYELAEDGVREFYRMAASKDVDDCQSLPDDAYHQLWRQGMGVCRHVTDTALDLLTRDLPNAPERRKRPESGSATWNSPVPLAPRVRPGDYSVLYAMHYFNDNADAKGNGNDEIALGAHVDPSLLVMEPFLSPDSRGLQVWDRVGGNWMDCDGPDSPCLHLAPDTDPDTNTSCSERQGHEHPRQQVVSLLFGGRALAAHTGIEATLHRVVAGSRNRRAVIYEQKYEEFFPPPIMD